MSDCDDLRVRLVMGARLADADARHLATCAACRAEEPAARALATALAADAGVEPPPGLSARVLRVAAAPLARHARRVARPDWRALGRAVAVAVLPLPVLVYLDTLVVRGAYRVLSTVLPHLLSLYVVGSYAVVLAFLLTLTYAAVPLLAARQAGPAAGGAHA